MDRIIAREAEPYSDLLPEARLSCCYIPKSLSEIIDFSRFLAIPATPRIHTVYCATDLCDCLDPTNHASVMERLGENTCSDMTIKCHGKVYHANRNVLCPKSSFFDRAMNGSFKESITGTIELPDDDPEILEYFLEFFYTGDYTDGVPRCYPCRQRLQDLEEALKWWFLTSDDESSWVSSESDEAEGADKPEGSDNRHTAEDMADLITWCEEDFDKNLEEYQVLPKTHRSHPCVNMTLPLRLYIMAVKYDVKPLANLARERFITAFANYEWKYMPQVVDELYQNTLSTADRLIRWNVIQALVDKMYKYKSVFLIFQPVMLKHRDFAVELLQGFFSPFYRWGERMGTSLLFPSAMRKLIEYS